MSYITDRCIENDLSLVRLQDTATGTIITVLPSYGALLHSFIIPIKGGSINIIDNYPGKDEIDMSLRLTYKGSKLSPFVCRIPEGKYYLRDKEYEITHKFFDGSAIHGLLFNKAFSITDQFADDELASVVLRYHYKKEDPGYPFDYVCEIRYILHPRNSLQVETTILNLDDVSIPVADGWHPYFRLGNLIDDYTLHFASQNMLEFNDKLIPTGKLIHDPAFIHPAAIGNREIDNCFLLEPISLFLPANLYMIPLLYIPLQ